MIVLTKQNTYACSYCFVRYPAYLKQKNAILIFFSLKKGRWQYIYPSIIFKYGWNVKFINFKRVEMKMKLIPLDGFWEMGGGGGSW